MVSCSNFITWRSFLSFYGILCSNIAYSVLKVTSCAHGLCKITGLIYFVVSLGNIPWSNCTVPFYMHFSTTDIVRQDMQVRALNFKDIHALISSVISRKTQRQRLWCVLLRWSHINGICYCFYNKFVKFSIYRPQFQRHANDICLIFVY